MSRSSELLDPQRAPRGVATLLKTPFKDENRLDEVSYRLQVRHVIDAGTVLLLISLSELLHIHHSFLITA